MLSNRTAWIRSANRLARLLEECRSSGRSILDLTETNPTRAGISYPEEELRQVLAHPDLLKYDPDPRGLPAAREAVSRHFGSRGLAVDPGDLILSSGTSEAYAWIFKLLADAGDEVMVPHPSYPLFEHLAGLESVRCVPYLLSADGGWSLDMAALISRSGPRARAVVVVSPNNPTGTYLKRAELRDLARFCRERGMALIGDEVFAEYPSGADEQRAASVLDAEGILSFSLGGLSKLAGLPQLKLSWIAVGGPPDSRREALERLELMADTYLSVNTPVQRAAPDLLRLSGRIRDAISRRLEANRKVLRERIGRDSAARGFSGEGGWSALIRVPAVMSEEDWVLSLLELDRVLVHPGYFFDFPSPAYLVLSLLPREEEFREGLERILLRAERA
jgi:alanine-synthesizing transaminase